MNVSTCIAINKGWVSSRKEELQEGHSQLSHKTSPRSSIDLSTDMICLEGQGGKNFKSMACKAVLALLLPAFRIIHKEKELKPSVVSTCQMQPAITAMTRGHHVADLITVSLSCSWAEELSPGGLRFCLSDTRVEGYTEKLLGIDGLSRGASHSTLLAPACKAQGTSQFDGAGMSNLCGCKFVDPHLPRNGGVQPWGSP
eukprot:1144759-Pelagomonas_calceolata.AAC.2